MSTVGNSDVDRNIHGRRVAARTDDSDNRSISGFTSTRLPGIWYGCGACMVHCRWWQGATAESMTVCSLVDPTLDVAR
jgi:hypothetical protein